MSLRSAAKGKSPDAVLVEFTPKLVGAYVVSVDYNGTSIQGSPCTVKCYDPRQVVVNGVQNANKGETVQFVGT